MELTVVIPTHDRLPILRETLARLDRQLGNVEFEVLVVDDASADGIPEAIRDSAARSSFPLTLMSNPGQGPAAARNRAIAVARAPVCLFINDDTWPRPDLLLRHRDFHRGHQEREAALLGQVTLAPDPPPTPFMRWLADQVFESRFDDVRDVGGRRFFTANVSAKTDFLRAVGGFDEGLTAAAHEDIDLGLRLEACGMRLVYDARAVVEHCHPMDLAMAIERMHMVGRELAPFVERHPDWTTPRRPGLRHRALAFVLTSAVAVGARPPALRREVWRFLCHEAAREAYWDEIDGIAPAALAPSARLRIGSTLARLAQRDEDVRLPASGPLWRLAA